jgi:hypothetical protein
MKDFLDVADGLHRSGRAADSTHEFKLVFDGLSQLQGTQSKIDLSYLNMESAFAAFEMAGVIGKLGEMKPEDINRLPSAMRRLIFRTIELTVLFPFDVGRTWPTEDYGRLVELFRGLDPSMNWVRSSVITFNYDVALDYALMVAGIPIDYCLADSRPQGALRLMKLHGSLNWKWCDRCQGLVEEWDLAKFLKGRIIYNPSGKPIPLEIASEISKQKHTCGDGLQPFLVPPTWNKAVYSTRLARVWAGAAAELADAEEIIVIGYSLPPSDVFFKYLLALGTAGPTIIKMFRLYDPGAAVAPRFEELLARAAKDRFEPFQMRFDEALPDLEKKFGVYSGVVARPVIITRPPYG